MEVLSIMIVDDEAGYRKEIAEYLTGCGFETIAFELPLDALAWLEDHSPDLAVLDLRLPQMSGLELMKRIQEHDPEVGIIMISGHGDMDSVISALREGAIDFFQKPFKLIDIRYAIERSRHYLDLQQRLNRTQDTCRNIIERINRQNAIPMLGSSSATQQVIHLMGQVGPNPNTDVLITGESGTGKELVAHGIHLLGTGADKVFFDVNCTAIPETLFESEFFGHTRNAFTGAQSEKKGWFEIANGGTLFLDEIGDLPLPMQAKLLRVLEERRIRRVGSHIEITLNLRIIVSTNKDLKELISRNLFREDLYYRLNRFEIHLSPLRERLSDIPALVQYYIAHFSHIMKKPVIPIASNALNALCSHSYPGNVRELKNLIEKAIILSADCDRLITLNHFPDLIRSTQPLLPFDDDLDLNRLDTTECAMIQRAMQMSRNNKTKAADLLKITRTSLNRRIAKYKLEF
jgi:DNA-binding NtrC family response regulator